MQITITDTDPTDPNSNAAIMAAIQELRKDMSALTDAIAALTPVAAEIKTEVSALASKEVVTPEDVAAVAAISTDLTAALADLKTFVGAAPTPPAGA